MPNPYYRKIALSIFLVLSFWGVSSAQDILQKSILPVSNSSWLNKLELRELSTIEGNVYRVWTKNEVIEIITNNIDTTGTVTAFVIAKKSSYQSKTDTFIVKEELYRGEIRKALTILGEIDRKKKSAQPIEKAKLSTKRVYIIEQKNGKNDALRSYYPQSFVRSEERNSDYEKFKELRKELALSKRGYRLMRRFPKRGIYSDGLRELDCNCKNKFSLGYRASTNLPIGIYAASFLGDVGKAHLYLGTNLRYSQNSINDRDLAISVTKYDLFNNKFSSVSESLNYRYRYRVFSFQEYGGVSQNHKFLYGLTAVNRLTLAAGVDFLSRKETERGLLLQLKTNSKRNNFKTHFMASIFQTHVDYRVSVSRAIKAGKNNKLLLGLAYENFYGFRDFYFSASYLF